MCFSLLDRKRKTFLISSDVHPQTIAVCKTRAEGFGVSIKVVHHSEFDLNGNPITHRFN
jgi:glycine dehydrogenase